MILYDKLIIITFCAYIFMSCLTFLLRVFSFIRKSGSL